MLSNSLWFLSGVSLCQGSLPWPDELRDRRGELGSGRAGGNHEREGDPGPAADGGAKGPSRTRRRIVRLISFLFK